MTMDKHDVMIRLQNGESAIDLANEFAAMLNGAMDEIEAQKAKDNKAATKRELAKRFHDLVIDYAKVECPEAMDIIKEMGDEDMDEMVEAIDEMFSGLRAMIELKKTLESLGDMPAPKLDPKAKATVKSDDDILASFLAHLN